MAGLGIVLAWLKSASIAAASALHALRTLERCSATRK